MSSISSEKNDRSERYQKLSCLIWITEIEFQPKTLGVSHIREKDDIYAVMQNESFEVVVTMSLEIKTKGLD
jgi:hypothetical protein